jgi:hypothetical protein
VRLGQVPVHGVHHVLRGVRAGHGQHRRVQVLDQGFGLILACSRRTICASSYLLHPGSR